MQPGQHVMQPVSLAGLSHGWRKIEQPSGSASAEILVLMQTSMHEIHAGQDVLSQAQG